MQNKKAKPKRERCVFGRGDWISDDTLERAGFSICRLYSASYFSGFSYLGDNISNRIWKLRKPITLTEA